MMSSNNYCKVCGHVSNSPIVCPFCDDLINDSRPPIKYAPVSTEEYRLGKKVVESICGKGGWLRKRFNESYVKKLEKGGIKPSNWQNDIRKELLEELKDGRINAKEVNDRLNELIKHVYMYDKCEFISLFPNRHISSLQNYQKLRQKKMITPKGEDVYEIYNLSHDDKLFLRTEIMKMDIRTLSEEYLKKIMENYIEGIVRYNSLLQEFHYVSENLTGQIKSNLKRSLIRNSLPYSTIIQNSIYEISNLNYTIKKEILDLLNKGFYSRVIVGDDSEQTFIVKCDEDKIKLYDSKDILQLSIPFNIKSLRKDNGGVIDLIIEMKYKSYDYKDIKCVFNIFDDSLKNKFYKFLEEKFYDCNIYQICSSCNGSGSKDYGNGRSECYTCKGKGIVINYTKKYEIDYPPYCINCPNSFIVWLGNKNFSCPACSTRFIFNDNDNFLKMRHELKQQKLQLIDYLKTQTYDIGIINELTPLINSNKLSSKEEIYVNVKILTKRKEQKLQLIDYLKTQTYDIGIINELTPLINSNNLSSKEEIYDNVKILTKRKEMSNLINERCKNIRKYGDLFNYTFRMHYDDLLESVSNDEFLLVKLGDSIWDMLSIYYKKEYEVLNNLNNLVLFCEKKSNCFKEEAMEETIGYYDADDYAFELFRIKSHKLKSDICKVVFYIEDYSFDILKLYDEALKINPNNNELILKKANILQKLIFYKSKVPFTISSIYNDLVNLNECCDKLLNLRFNKDEIYYLKANALTLFARSIISWSLYDGFIYSHFGPDDSIRGYSYYIKDYLSNEEEIELITGDKNTNIIDYSIKQLEKSIKYYDKSLKICSNKQVMLDKLKSLETIEEFYYYKKMPLHDKINHDITTSEIKELPNLINQKIDVYNNILAIEPQNTDILFKKEMDLYYLQKYDECLIYCDKILELLNSANFLEEKKSIDEGIDLINLFYHVSSTDLLCLELKSMDIKFRLNRKLEICKKLDRIDEAIDTYNSLLQLPSNDIPVNEVVKYCIDSKRYGKAWEFFENYVNDDVWWLVTNCNGLYKNIEKYDNEKYIEIKQKYDEIQRRRDKIKVLLDSLNDRELFLFKQHYTYTDYSKDMVISYLVTCNFSLDVIEQMVLKVKKEYEEEVECEKRIRAENERKRLKKQKEISERKAKRAAERERVRIYNEDKKEKEIIKKETIKDPLINHLNNLSSNEEIIINLSRLINNDKITSKEELEKQVSDLEYLMSIDDELRSKLLKLHRLTPSKSSYSQSKRLLDNVSLEELKKDIDELNKS